MWQTRKGIKGFCVLHKIFSPLFIHYNCICRWETWSVKKLHLTRRKCFCPPLHPLCTKCSSQGRDNWGGGLGWKGKSQWDPALRLGNGTLTGCCALVVLGGPHKVHHLCSLLPQPEPSWRGFAVFSDRSLSISRVGKCSSPESVLSIMCCTCQAPLFAGRETLAAIRREVFKSLQHGQAKLARQPRKVRFPDVFFVMLSLLAQMPGNCSFWNQDKMVSSPVPASTCFSPFLCISYQAHCPSQSVTEGIRWALTHQKTTKASWWVLLTAAYITSLPHPSSVPCSYSSGACLPAENLMDFRDPLAAWLTQDLLSLTSPITTRLLSGGLDQFLYFVLFLAPVLIHKPPGRSMFFYKCIYLEDKDTALL